MFQRQVVELEIASRCRQRRLRTVHRVGPGGAGCRGVQRKPARVAVEIQQRLARGAHRHRMPVLALVEKQPTLLAAAQIHDEANAVLAHLDLAQIAAALLAIHDL